MKLHIVNRAPDAGRAVEQALSAMAAEDRLLLIEDGVQGALPSLVDEFASIEGRLYALHEDLEARGLMNRHDERVEVVDVEGFVTLTEQAERTLSWY
ncbi:sulfurtransferase complex subunit TusB [Halomonas caseinilytica]|uniref:tRNA 2-thiouridine synthesizing protein B n=1 Tax=Halomonas caseinilytica TaxID=438744 RepID=A0A1M6PDH0_9GAMM|nr:sulfurtransferase complex subunit TusB [Halomonas caseinilytica]SEM20741.1 tRNA 2-thiouridine synthesizing protein B [Halomonas caseinilytica]SHK05986.1 tRNA 2-thiouridine synthesizing protein B [Halomonas caseinilytica]